MFEIRSSLQATRTLSGAVPVVLVTAAFALAQGLAQRSAHAQAAAPAATKQAKAPADRAALDLHAPPLNHVIPRRQLQIILATDDSGALAGTEISVKSVRYVAPVPGAPGNQLVAIPWAILHPTQAWRIFTPIEQP